MSFPVERHVSSLVKRRRERLIPPADLPTITELTRLHEIFNARHFAGTLRTIPITLSGRMSTRLGEFRGEKPGLSGEITIARRHVEREGWASVMDTLLHEMIHQWQWENGLPIDHGAGFRRKAREVGVHPAATVPYHVLAASRAGKKGT
jgi:hypothetical protein